MKTTNKVRRSQFASMAASAEEAGVPAGEEDEEDGAEAGATSDEEDLGLDDGSISGQLAHFLRTSGFDDKLFTFLHAEADTLEISPEGEEQKLEVYEAYQRFTQLFDGEFSDFMQKNGCASMDEIFERLQAEDKADDRASRFFEGLLAGMEYTAFITLVRNFQEADDDDEEEEDDEEDLGECDDDDDQAQDTSVPA